MTATCSSCPATLGPKNKSGYCRSCVAKRLNTDPVVAGRRKAAIQARFEDPKVRAAHKARLQHYMDTMPEADRQARRERGQRLAAGVLKQPEVVAKREAKRLSPESRQRQGQSLSDTMLPWCPREHRPLYRELRVKGIPAADARAAVEAEMAAASARPAPRRPAKRPLTHQEQLARVAAGAALEPVFKPTTTHDFTLGGVATGMI